ARAGDLGSVRFRARAAVRTTASPDGGSGDYRIDVRWIGQATPRQRQAVTSAVARWEGVIRTDAPDVPVNVAADRCFKGQPPVSEVIDDLIIFVHFESIDGRGKTLGEA